jgi:hypothetical protein
VIARLAIAWCLATSVAAAADVQFGVLDIALDAPFTRLARDLDFHDLGATLARYPAGRPDFGRRGYACMQREDALADASCVSHTEQLDGIETREIRLHFLEGRLLQFSLTAEVRHYAAVVAYLQARYGAPQAIPARDDGNQPAVRWQSETGRVDAYRGKDLVFVNFEMVAYAEAVKRKREGERLKCD